MVLISIAVVEFLPLAFMKGNIDLNFGLAVQLGPKFVKENGLKLVTFSTADGALEAAPEVRIVFVLLEVFRYNKSFVFVLFHWSSGGGCFVLCLLIDITSLFCSLIQ